MRVRLVFSEALRSIATNASTTVAATMTVLIAMCLLGLSIALGSWALSWSNHVKKELLVKVYFKQSAGPAQFNAVANRLKDDTTRVQSVDFISSADALKIMQRKLPQLTRDLTSNPLPASLEVTPTKGEYTQAIAQSLSPPPAGVSGVNYGRKTAQRILKVAKLIWFVFVAAVVVLVVASTLLIANTIRLSIFSRRREIEVMKLVGATNWFIRGPFMLEGLICGLAGSVVAIVLLLLGKQIALPGILSHADAGGDVQALRFSLTALILLGVGLFLGAAGSGLTLRRFLRV